MDSQTWEITTTLLRLSRTVENSFARLFSTFGIGFTDLRLMMMVLVFHGVSQKDLATRLGLSQVVVSTRVDRLERNGMVSRAQVGRRSVSLGLTPAGKRMLNLLMLTIEQSAPGKALSSLNPTESQAVFRALQSVRSAIEMDGDLQPENGVASPFSRLRAENLGELKCPDVDIEQVLQEENARIRRTMDQLGQELDALIQAYRMLRPDYTE